MLGQFQGRSPPVSLPRRFTNVLYHGVNLRLPTSQKAAHIDPYFLRVSMETLGQRALRLRLISRRRNAMDNIAVFLNSMAESIEETSARCTDPVIVSELQYAVEKLREKAHELAGQ